MPIVFLGLIRPDRKKNPRLLKTLLDSGESASVVFPKVVQNLDTERSKFTAFQTMTGMFNTTHMCETKCKVLELDRSSEISKKMHVTQMNGRHNVILGQYVLKNIVLVIKFHTETICWNNAVIDMKSPDCIQETSYWHCPGNGNPI